MAELVEHMAIAAFQTAYKVCVCVYASIKFITGDSVVPHEPGTEWQGVDGKYRNEYYRTVCGTWQYVDDPIVDDEYKEIMQYTMFTYYLQKYRDFLLNRLASEDRRSLEICQDKVDTLSDWIKTIPEGRQLVTKFKHPISKISQWCYNTSYLKFSRTNKLTRSWLVANLPTIVLQLESYKNTFIAQLPANYLEDHKFKYECLKNAYDNWFTRAAPRVKVPFHTLQQREVNGQHTNLRALLEELRCIATQNE